jgi:hypothetical protein
MNTCLNCQEKTKNKKYCSRSCAAIVNNKITPKRKVEPQNICLLCNSKLSRRIGSRKNQICFNCYQNQRKMDTHIKYGLKTKQEVMTESLSYSSKHRYEKIRQHAKRCCELFKWKNSNRCEKCSYNIHTELCHIKPISEFSDDTILNVINDRSNVIFLCPNCHWEFDNKL